MSDMFTQRQASLLRAMRFGSTYVASDLASLIVASSATLRRDLVQLEHYGAIVRQGAKRGTTYSKTLYGALHTPLDAHAYCAQQDRTSVALAQYQTVFLDELPTTLFDAETRTILDEATTQYKARNAASAPGVRAREEERLVIELSWKSSAIEGNTYTLLDTERLLRERVEAEGHSKQETLMILNHKKAFDFIRMLGNTRLSLRVVEDLHTILTADLGIARGVRRGEVGVLGAEYRPPSVPAQLESELSRLTERIEGMSDHYSAALLALLGVSYLQPFEDGNKRTARLLANAVLIARGCAPLSYRNVDVVQYRESMLAFYEQLSIVPMRTIFVEQYRFSCEHYLGL